MCSLVVLVFNCDTNPCKAEEVWQPASPDEEVTELSIMALVGSQIPFIFYLHSFMYALAFVGFKHLSLLTCDNINLKQTQKILKIVISLNMDLFLVNFIIVTFFQMLPNCYRQW